MKAQKEIDRLSAELAANHAKLTSKEPDGVRHTPYRVEFNKKCGLYQIFLPNFNVAIAEFYKPSASEAKNIARILGNFDALVAALEQCVSQIRALQSCAAPFQDTSTVSAAKDANTPPR